MYQLWSPALALYLLIILLFPEGHVPAPRWRWAVWAYGLLCGGYLALLIGVAVDAIDRHRLQVDSYGGLTAIDYPAGWFALAQDTILVLTLAARDQFRRPPTAQLAAVVRGATPAAQMADRRGRLAIVCAALSVPGYTAPSGLWAWLNGVLTIGFVALPASIGVGHPEVPAVRDRPADLPDAGIHDRHRTADRRVRRLVALAHAVVPFGRRSPSPWRRWPPSRCSTRCAAESSDGGQAVQPRPLRRRDDDRGVRDRMRDATDLEEIRLDLLAVAYQALEPAHILLWLPGSGQRGPRDLDE